MLKYSVLLLCLVGCSHQAHQSQGVPTAPQQPSCWGRIDQDSHLRRIARNKAIACAAVRDAKLDAVDDSIPILSHAKRALIHEEMDVCLTAAAEYLSVMYCD